MSKKELFKNLLIFTQGSLMISMTKLGEFLETSSSKYCKVHSELKQFERFNSHLPARIIQLEYNAVTNSQYSRRETIKLKHGSAETKDVLEENSIPEIHDLKLKSVSKKKKNSSWHL